MEVKSGFRYEVGSENSDLRRVEMVRLRGVLGWMVGVGLVVVGLVRNSLGIFGLWAVAL